MFRILPITLLAMMLAIPLHFDVLVKESPALAGVSSSLGFGDHPRPWAEDLIDREGDPKNADPVVAPFGPDADKARRLLPDAPNSMAAMSAAVSPEAPMAVCATEQSSEEGRLFRLMATERRVEEQIVRLAALKRELEQLLQRQSKMDEASIQQLVKIYRNMKPEEAARILEDMNSDIVVDIIGTMKERDAAPILARLSEATARKVTGELALRRSLTKLKSAE
ncbi:magnesium transporter MgtE N-terminal domain-containing protein [Rhodospirillaceae bacterium SYSU D60014]|uniref:MotE family protein n=1 Tax=Virgifigura deserti TaxID=2268457 RepID=UPI000E6617E3